MTLKEWAEGQPVRVARHPKYFNSFWVPDVPQLVDRAAAWRLSDYAVSSVSGGTIFFVTRNPIVEVPVKS